jgi:hypothetical protein
VLCGKFEEHFIEEARSKMKNLSNKYYPLFLDCILEFLYGEYEFSGCMVLCHLSTLKFYNFYVHFYVYYLVLFELWVSVSLNCGN